MFPCMRLNDDDDDDDDGDDDDDDDDILEPSRRNSQVWHTHTDGQTFF